MPLRAAWIEYRDAVRAFSRPAKQFLLSTLFTWGGHGVAQVLFNLYLVQAGYREAFVGQAVSLNGAGLAIMALPAGILAERCGKRRTLVAGACIEGVSMVVRAAAPSAAVIGVACFATGAGTALLAIASAPFLSEHSTARERTHLFSSFFAVELIAAVVGSSLGGALPKLLTHLPAALAHDLLHAYRYTLFAGAALAATAALPIARIVEPRAAAPLPMAAPGDRGDTRLLAAIAVNFFLIGAGAGLVIPFMNLYFATRFQCSSAQIGSFFALAQLITATAAMLAPVLARRFGKLGTATAMQFLSLPFLVTLGAEKQLGVAVAAFCVRATLMQASSPLLQAYVMEMLPAARRARSTSLNNLVWNTGWASSATLSGWMIQQFGYAVPFYVTAGLYGVATTYFYLMFRRHRPPDEAPVGLSEESKGRLGDGPFTE